MFRIKKLDIFIAKQFGLLFVGTFFICQFVLMMQFLWRYVDELIGKGLTLDVLAQFFWYMGLMLIPQAFPLAILLSSLITFGNLGESSELTAIKAAGISLMKCMRSLIVLVVVVAGVSFYFQDVIGPKANKSFAQLLLSMKQKSPELEIPEGIFYDGLPNTNLYVQKKDMDTGKLYGVMIYRQSGSYEDQAIILADSGMLQSTAEKKHLLLTLWSGEWFENMRSQDLGNAAEVPYRRETFTHKQILLDFDGGFNLADASGIASSAKAKSNAQILHDLDSIRQSNDSIGRQFYREALTYAMAPPALSAADSTRLEALTAADVPVLDSLFDKMSGDERRDVTKNAARQAQNALSDLAMKADYAKFLHRNERTHLIEAIGKYTLALSCIIFFFIGAPLGAIIRKGGLGVPVIISVIVFIVYYIFENSGMRMARDDNWTVWFGKSISTVVLAPLAVFFTYKANNDSTVFNIDAYRLLFMRMFGLRMKRNITRKEVIIDDPVYALDSYRLLLITEDIRHYNAEHRLLTPPNPIKVFFHPGDDQTIEQIADKLEAVIDDLGNTKDHQLISLMNSYPVMATHAHTRPFRRKWLNVITGLVLPVGLFFYLRMCRFRLRLHKDLNKVVETSQLVVRRIAEIAPPAPVTLADVEQMTFIADLAREAEAKESEQ
ncbi:MAG: LptF/LptG family permease [Prevotella sp.]|nr:LptF/LptG family permease [Prevotella sp.]